MMNQKIKKQKSLLAYYAGRRTAGRQGLTLVETLVAIAIFAIGIEGFSLLFVNAWKNNSYTLEMGQSSMAVSQGVNTIVNYLRSIRQSDNGAYPIYFADDNDLVAYSDYDRDGVTERIHIYKSNTDILMGVTDPTVTMPKSYPSADQQILTLARRIVNTSAEPIFYYYDKNYAGGSTQVPLVTPANVADVRLMKIHLKINIDPNRAPDNIELQTFVEMRNLNDYDRIH
ncbi:MAG: prepilin-type N-terminal cleavage/methylation domain-containing protein [Parcubacteria group bacterium]|jgi:prepilin-type N-terminal cleavage/methylation domain-containing protein